jgi:hypothetical protein
MTNHEIDLNEKICSARCTCLGPESNFITIKYWPSHVDCYGNASYSLSGGIKELRLSLKRPFYPFGVYLFSCLYLKPAKLAWSVENAYSRLKNNRIDVLDFS